MVQDSATGKSTPSVEGGVRHGTNAKADAVSKESSMLCKRLQVIASAALVSANKAVAHSQNGRSLEAITELRKIRVELSGLSELIAESEVLAHEGGFSK